MMTSIRGVVFDAYGTLFDVHSIGRKAEQLYPGQGSAISTLWRDKQIEYSRLVSLSDPSPQGSRHYQSFWALTRAALEYSLDRLGVAAERTQIDDLMRGYATLDAYPECEAVLRTVKAMGLPTAILSNGSPEMLHSAASSSGLLPHLDHLISVDGVRQFKTTPVCYELAPNTLQIPADALLFVSSNAWDALGATWFGFQTCWVNRQSLPRERLGPPPHHTCADLRGVLEAITHQEL
jgi:2-haloacid dehalogenase